MASIVVGTTATALVAFSVGKSLILKAAPGNAGIIYFGYTNAVTADTNVTNDGIPLSAGNIVEIEPHRCGNTSAGIFVIASVAAQKLFYDAR